MKRLTTGRVFIMALALLCVMSATGTSAAAALKMEDEHFSVREYNHFHEVLHPLQHEALPKKDFKTIRARAAELVTRGRAIIKLGVPAGVQDAPAFQKELKNFETALKRFKTAARRKSNARLEESYTAVHDSFEMLASMLPRKQASALVKGDKTGFSTNF